MDRREDTRTERRMREQSEEGRPLAPTGTSELGATGDEATRRGSLSGDRGPMIQEGGTAYDDTAGETGISGTVSGPGGMRNSGD